MQKKFCYLLWPLCTIQCSTHWIWHSGFGKPGCLITNAYLLYPLKLVCESRPSSAQHPSLIQRPMDNITNWIWQGGGYCYQALRLMTQIQMNTLFMCSHMKNINNLQQENRNWLEKKLDLQNVIPVSIQINIYDRYLITILFRHFIYFPSIIRIIVLF